MTEQKDRISLNKGEELELEFRAREGQKYIQKAVVEEQIGSGASCLTYIVRLFTDEYNLPLGVITADCLPVMSLIIAYPS